ncbi:MAG: alkaline phosphatase family protein [Bacteroidia bacterium]
MRKIKFFLFFFWIGWAQKPHLVVGIVVDQMRADYLLTYQNQGAWKKLWQEGLVYLHATYPYFPTYTAVGHASIYTGSLPSIHGICANDWYDRKAKKKIYSVRDTTVHAVGSASSAGQASPRNLLATTITDELLLTHPRSKVISICIKDRAAILPGGHVTSHTYWFDASAGNWITSTFYTQKLPTWVEKFNSQKYPDSLLRLSWKPLASQCQVNTFRSYKELVASPHGNWLTLQLAKEAIIAETLGQRKNHTDFLAISLASPDLCGHLYGSPSCQLEDLYAKLSIQLEEFLRFLEKKVGKENVLVVVTSDHGVARTPEYLSSKKIPAGRSPDSKILAAAESLLKQTFPHISKPIEYFINQNLYLSSSLTPQEKAQACQLLKEYMIHIPPIIAVYTAQELAQGQATHPLAKAVQNGFFPPRSGDVILQYAPGYIEAEGYTTGTTHGSAFTYDAHVPLIFWGSKIKPRKIYTPVSALSIVPTLAHILQVTLPSGTVEVPLQEVLSFF